VGNQVFAYGLSDPNLWSNSAGVIDTGFDWYLTRYLKVYFDWQHSMFGRPVYQSPGGFEKTADMFLLRVQLYF
jgi:phosphate-selective porin OprO/OprP